ncbi:uncharacterized protein BDR25DRAFT_358208 [Lindgomyces ingoldianus]|uniref:Uncharacterized protein n=1 Tax=Lindgomyces ingoldianus TaxID=673940 RepID=A0ACB6QLY6_9PLEO|nr:uncharacterized protein BDR25DRAFT_358208 [Lindgomyces ingoldianus]KAF2467958.1 hypothetical protein BDR25DRAFT_358208 [Lindgomyces ingoldianus]
MKRASGRSSSILCSNSCMARASGIQIIPGILQRVLLYGMGSSSPVIHHITSLRVQLSTLGRLDHLGVSTHLSFHAVLCSHIWVLTHVHSPFPVYRHLCSNGSRPGDLFYARNSDTNKRRLCCSQGSGSKSAGNEDGSISGDIGVKTSLNYGGLSSA